MKKGVKKKWSDIDRHLRQCWNCQHYDIDLDGICQIKHEQKQGDTDARTCRSFKPYPRAGVT